MDLPFGRSIFISPSSLVMFRFLSLFKHTSSELKFCWNDGGRGEAGFKGGAGDCVVRAIAIAARLPYMQVYDDLRNANAMYAHSRNDRLAKRLHETGSSPRNGNHRKVFHQYINHQRLLYNTHYYLLDQRFGLLINYHQKTLNQHRSFILLY